MYFFHLTFLGEDVVQHTIYFSNVILILKSNWNFVLEGESTETYDILHYVYISTVTEKGKACCKTVLFPVPVSIYLEMSQAFIFVPYCNVPCRHSPSLWLTSSSELACEKKFIKTKHLTCLKKSCVPKERTAVEPRPNHKAACTL